MSDKSKPKTGFFVELRRRNVFRVAAFYLVRQDPSANLDDEVIVYATLGRNEEALERLAFRESGKDYNAFWAYELEPGIDGLRKTEQYHAIQQRVRAKMAKQREEIRANGYHLVPADQ